MATRTFDTGDVVVSRIQNRRGNRVDLPQPLLPGEFGWCLDTKQLFIGLSEADAVAGLEIYRGSTINAQPIVQNLIDRRVVEFDTLYQRVSNIVPDQQDPGNYISEVTILNELATIPSGSYVDPQKRAVINNLENNVGILSTLTQAVRDSLVSPGGFEDQALITNGWIKREATPARLVVTAVAGVIQSVDAIADAGLGYLPAGASITLSDVNGDATFTATISNDGQGTVLPTPSILNAGTGYPNTSTIILDTPDLTTVQATGTASDTAGMITSTTVTFQGSGYQGVPTVSIVGNTGSGAVIEAVLTAGAVTGLNIVMPGAGYTSPIVLDIQAPVSNDLYKFTYDFGVEDKNGTLFVDPIAPDYTNLLASIAFLDALASVNTVGVLGNAPDAGPGFNPHNNEMVTGLLLLDTTRQASNVAAILNALSSLPTGLVTTKQNIEIITEFSDSGFSSDVLVEDLIRYELEPAASFTKITNVFGTYTDLDLEYDVNSSDVQLIDYSVYLNTSLGYTAAGSLMVVTNPKVTGSAQAALREDSVEVRDVNLASPILSPAPGFEFRAVYNIARQVTELEYKHGFPGNIILEVTTKRWISFA